MPSPLLSSADAASMGGVGTIPGLVLGVLFLRTVVYGVGTIIKTNAEAYEGLIVGGVVVIAVALTQLRQARREGKRFFAGLLGWVTVLNLAILAAIFVLVMSPVSRTEPTMRAGIVGGATLL